MDSKRRKVSRRTVKAWQVEKLAEMMQTLQISDHPQSLDYIQCDALLYAIEEIEISMKSRHMERLSEHIKHYNSSRPF